MKRKLWILAVLAGSICACQKLPPVNEPEGERQEQEEEPGLPAIDDTSGPALIGAEIPPVVPTKVSLTAGDAPGLSLAWEAGDCLRIIPGGSQSGEVFTIVEEGMTPSRAGFSGKPLSGSSFTVLYPGTFADEAAWKARSYAGQVQTGNGSTAHLEWNARVSGLSYYGSVFFASLSGQEYSQNGVIKFAFSLPERFASLESISLTLPDAVIPSTNDTESEFVSSLSLGLEDLGITADARDITAYMMVSPKEVQLAPGSTYVITLAGPGGQTEDIEKTVGEDGLVIGGGRVTVISLDAEDLQEPLFWAGEGTQASPYEIKTLKHLQNMNDLIASNAGASKLYFKLIDDIDMEGVDWLYKNNSINNNYPIDFNGGGHTIRNFSMTNWSASFFGAIKGEVYDVKFKDATIITNPTSASRGGLLAYRAGGADTPAYIHDVTVDGLSVTGTTSAVGGLVGALTNGTIENCSITGLTVSAQATAGGIAGEILDAASTISGCSVSGTISSTGSNVGGIVGNNDESAGELTISNCSVSGNLLAKSQIGGIIGRSKAAVCNISLCRTSGTFSSNRTGDYGYLGGIGGIMGPCNVSKCLVEATLSGDKGTGGLIATAWWGNVQISESAFSGDITARGTQDGGIVGAVNSSRKLTLSDSYSSGSITATAGGFSAGILGYLMDNGSLTMTNCYSSMNVKVGTAGSNAQGGLVGGADKTTQTWNVSGCLAWNSKIDFSAVNNTRTDGVIVGRVHSGSSSASTSLKNCWYRYDLDYTVGYTRAPGDDDDMTASPGNTRYDGKRVGDGVTCSAKAQSLGWSEGIWNLSADYPSLKNLPAKE